MLDRRQFLGALGGFALTAAAPKRVVIAGAGLAGLCAAYELRKRGYDVVVLEGQARPGGRVRTLRDEFAPGVFAEAGATRIPDHHDLTMRYAREFGLPLIPFEPPGFRKTFHVAGKNFSPGPGENVEWPVELTEEERKVTLDAMAVKYLLDPVLKLKSKSREPRVPQELMVHDTLTMKQFFARQGLSPAAAKLLFLGYPDETGSAAWILNVIENVTSCRNFYRLRDGNDRLPGAFVARLAGKVQYGCPVVSIGQSDTEAWAIVDRNGTRETVRGDFVVCTLPYSVARQHFAEARLSPRKSKAIQDQKYLEATKVFLQMRRQFWVEKKLSGFADTDLESERYWSLGDNNAVNRGVLLAYTVGPGAANMDRKTESERLKVALRDAELVFPGAVAEYEGGCSKSWMLDPWQKGVMAQYDPGELGNIEINAQKEGRIHFAGEHTSRWNGWMRGALESAHRVVREISGS